jgi:hypothetical protein
MKFCAGTNAGSRQFGSDDTPINEPCSAPPRPHGPGVGMAGGLAAKLPTMGAACPYKTQVPAGDLDQRQRVGQERQRHHVAHLLGRQAADRAGGSDEAAHRIGDSLGIDADVEAGHRRPDHHGRRIVDEGLRRRCADDIGVGVGAGGCRWNEGPIAAKHRTVHDLAVRHDHAADHLLAERGFGQQEQAGKNRGALMPAGSMRSQANGLHQLPSPPTQRLGAPQNEGGLLAMQSISTSSASCSRPHSQSCHMAQRG